MILKPDLIHYVTLKEGGQLLIWRNFVIYFYYSESARSVIHCLKLPKQLTIDSIFHVAYSSSQARKSDTFQFRLLFNILLKIKYCPL